MVTNGKKIALGKYGYRVKVELKVLQGGISHVGIAFNLRDSENYEGLYLR